MPLPLTLCIDVDPTTQYVRRLVLEACGYATDGEQFGEATFQAIAERQPDAVVLDAGHEEQRALAMVREIRRSNAELPLVVIVSRAVHVPEKNGDWVTVNRLDGPVALLQTLDSLLRFQHHRHEEIEGEYFAFVNRERRYLEVSQKFCDLVGYRRRELLSMKVDDLTAPQTANVPSQFEEYVEKGTQKGRYILRRKDGSSVAIEFRARVLPDGCMAASFHPLDVDVSQFKPEYFEDEERAG